MLQVDGIILRIDSETSLYALIGDPVEHSFSPLMQNAAFKTLSLNSVYLALEVKPPNLKVVVKGLKGLRIPGFNVTIPHKIEIMGLLDEVDPKASQIGAVNTVHNDGGRLIGYNTDGAGALEPDLVGGLPREDIEHLTVDRELVTLPDVARQGCSAPEGHDV